ncbi:MAG TPA: class I SAM-dependent methyltransferase [Methylophilaceae bacterium]
MIKKLIVSHQPELEPSAWLVRHANLIKLGGRVLDVAAGSGRNAHWLANQGFQVEAVDINAESLAGMVSATNINTRVADLENAPWPYVDEQFDAIVVCRYLYRPLLPVLPLNLAIGGVLIYETFMQGHETYGRPQNPDFLLIPDELEMTYCHQLHIVSFEQGLLSKNPPAMMQRICAINEIK